MLVVVVPGIHIASFYVLSAASLSLISTWAKILQILTFSKISYIWWLSLLKSIDCTELKEYLYIIHFFSLLQISFKLLLLPSFQLCVWQAFLDKAPLLVMPGITAAKFSFFPLLSGPSMQTSFLLSTSPKVAESFFPCWWFTLVAECYVGHQSRKTIINSKHKYQQFHWLIQKLMISLFNFHKFSLLYIFFESISEYFLIALM